MTNAVVEVQYGNINVALKKFKKKIERAGLMEELHRRSYYMKPSKAKKEKSRRAASRRKGERIRELREKAKRDEYDISEMDLQGFLK